MLRLLVVALVCVRVWGALRAPLLDCDEVYNYWEPLAFLVRGFARQPWEYAPLYALRSYAFLYPWSLLSHPLKWLGGDMRQLFYAVRLVLALAFAFAESCLASQLAITNGSMATWFLLAQIASPGMFVAAVALLPNSVALLFGIFATTYVLRYFHSTMLMDQADSELAKLESVVIGQHQEKEVDTDTETKKDVAPVDADPDAETGADLNLEVVQSLLKIKVYTLLHAIMTKNFTLAVLFTALAGFACWPFVLVLLVPFAIFALARGLQGPRSTRLEGKFPPSSTILTLILTALSCAFFVPYFVSQVDFLFYKKTVIFSYNLVAYNVFSDLGPSLYGTEGPLYYLKNLALNFHIILPIAALNLALLPTKVQLVAYKLPLAIWLIIFHAQDHKEERFLYPIFHLVSLSFAQLMACPTFKANVVFRVFKIALNVAVVVSMLVLGFLRINNLVESYSNYQAIFTPLASLPGGNVCIGREWHHYPSSFFLGDNQRLKFTRSAFNGLLPGQYLEDGTGTFAAREEFNNRNAFQPSFLVSSLDECDYYVDTSAPTDSHDQTSLKDWDVLDCRGVVDYDRSSGLDRVLGIRWFVEQYIIEPWGRLQEDPTSIEFNRKIMEMYGIQRPGTEMYTEFYQWLRPHWEKFTTLIGTESRMGVCLAKRKL